MRGCRAVRSLRENVRLADVSTDGPASDDPVWVAHLIEQLDSDHSRQTGIPDPPSDARAAAVLVALADTPTGPDVLLLERASTLRTHAGQMAFPGGAIDPSDADAVAAALREAGEEVGLQPDSARVLGQLPAIWVIPSNFAVTPVLAYWFAPHDVFPREGEVMHVVRVPIAALANPANRVRVQLTNGHFGPAFQIDSRLIWGFTAAVLDVVLHMGGWSVPWNRNVLLPHP